MTHGVKMMNFINKHVSILNIHRKYPFQVEIINLSIISFRNGGDGGLAFHIVRAPLSKDIFFYLDRVQKRFIADQPALFHTKMHNVANTTSGVS